MTKKDYEVIASVFKNAYHFEAHILLVERELKQFGSERYKRYKDILNHADRIVIDMAVALREKDPKFNWEKFCLACGMAKDERGIWTYTAIIR